LAWYDKNARTLPWRDIARNEVDPNTRGYSVLVSEIMLQQTQVATVIDYYNRWISKWPGTKELSEATLEQINQAWSGLGYYSRGRRLWEGARYVEETLGGSMPQTRVDLLKLSGVGKYTASAVASIAFGAQVGVVDGNVLRVLSRLRGIGAPIDNQKVVDHMWKLADDIVDKERPGDFNQAMMELGATVCTPKSPSCVTCPVKSMCAARALNAASIVDIEDSCVKCGKSDLKMEDGVLNYPRKGKKTASRDERTLVLALSYQNSASDLVYAVQQRPASGLLANLWELLTVPGKGKQVEEDQDAGVKQEKEEKDLKDEKEIISTHLETLKIAYSQLKKKGEVNHVFSHINMTYVLYTASMDKKYEGLELMTLDDFLVKGTSTAMKKVVKLLQSSSDNSCSKKRKSLTASTASDPKQRSINTFFKSVKRE